MPWKEVSVMSQRWEFVELANQSKGNFTELCRRFEISRDTGYKWLNMRRYRAHGGAGLDDGSRRPRHSPGRTGRTMEQRIVSLRDHHPAWGAWKIQARLKALGVEGVPAPSTVHQVLRRQGRIDPAASAQHRAWQRFEQAAPNQLWQMDFKGHFGLGNGERCHPLTVRGWVVRWQRPTPKATPSAPARRGFSWEPRFCSGSLPARRQPVQDRQ
jgi:transposase InsO family protein